MRTSEIGGFEPLNITTDDLAAVNAEAEEEGGTHEAQDIFDLISRTPSFPIQERYSIFACCDDSYRKISMWLSLMRSFYRWARLDRKWRETGLGFSIRKRMLHEMLENIEAPYDAVSG